MNAKPTIWLLFILLALSLTGVGLLWSQRSSARESLIGVRDELQVALGRNRSLAEELQRSENDVAELTGLLHDTQDKLRLARAELKKSADYIARLEGQLGVSEESLGRIEALIGRGNELVEEGRDLLQKGEN